MGCGASNASHIVYNEFTNLETLDPDQIWHHVDSTLDIPKGRKNPNANLVVKRSGWKTIRIFVSSTFKDFHHEREVLVKQVFPDLRAWCEQRRLHLVECDLRWGVPKDSTSDLTLKMCLGEIDRCSQDNIMPFFLHMTSKRIGWIPLPPDIPEHLVNEYRWVFGLSITEMEIVHGAYRKDNPNALFLLRDDSFMDNLPDDVKAEFVDEYDKAPHKLKVLRAQISDRFKGHRVRPYSAEFVGKDEITGKPKLKLDDSFQKTVFEFFQARIAKQYPLYEGQEDPMEKRREAHEAFMKSRSEMVLGRSQILKQISDYVCGSTADVPLLILGPPGMGKSSIMAKAADDTCMMAHNSSIQGGGRQGWYVFHHFVGAVPGSTDLLATLCRLLKEIGAAAKDSLPTDIDTAVSLVMGALNNPRTRPVIIFIDALNQFDDDKASTQSTWVPRKLPPNVRCVFSMIDQTPHHTNLCQRESKPVELLVEPLSLKVRQDMVEEYLLQFNKRLDESQMSSLLSKEASENPLWLSIACEELRVFGNFRQVSDKINNLPDGLLDLLDSVLSRFEREGGGHLLMATLCLIEVSTFGLLESELLSLLADEDNLLPPDNGGKEKGEKEAGEKENKCKVFDNKLPAIKWASVYRSLRPFLRPFGDSGEGRLDFYHRTLSKVVRRKYFKVASATEQDTQHNTYELNATYKWFHSKLADFFEVSANLDRKVEEYPHHLICLNDTVRLQTFLCDWKTIDKLYNYEHSPKLLYCWTKCGGFDMMTFCYAELLQELKAIEETNTDLLCNRYFQMANILTQGGKYNEADELLKETLQLEQKLGSRREKMADMTWLQAHIWDQKSKLNEFVLRSQIPETRTTLDYIDKAIEYAQALSSQAKHKQKWAKLLITSAFQLATMADCGGDTISSVAGARKEANEKLDKAMAICKELNDNLHLAEALMTKATIPQQNISASIKMHEEAMALCSESYGDYHPLMGRIHHNLSMCYENKGDYLTAYRGFRQNYLISLEVYGKSHVKTERTANILREEMYRQIAREEGHEDN